MGRLRTTFFALIGIGCIACSAADDTVAGDDSNFTSDRPAPAPAPSTEVAQYTDADVSGTPKLRFAVGGGAITEAVDVTWTTAISGTERRFQFQGMTPTQGGLPALYVEFGRGQAPIDAGVYDCSRQEAVVVLVVPGGKKMTAVAGKPSRPCTVTVEGAVPMPVTAGHARYVRRVVGRIEATVGPREDSAGATEVVHAAFAAIVTEQ